MIWIPEKILAAIRQEKRIARAMNEKQAGLHVMYSVRLPYHDPRLGPLTSTGTLAIPSHNEQIERNTSSSASSPRNSINCLTKPLATRPLVCKLLGRHSEATVQGFGFYHPDPLNVTEIARLPPAAKTSSPIPETERTPVRKRQPVPSDNSRIRI